MLTALMLRQALSLVPGDPVTCDLLKLVLDDTVDQLSIRPDEFPGLPKSILASIDEQVAALDEDIRNEGRGGPALDVMPEGDEPSGREPRAGVSMSGLMSEGDTMEDETMEETMDQTME